MNKTRLFRLDYYSYKSIIIKIPTADKPMNTQPCFSKFIQRCCFKIAITVHAFWHLNTILPQSKIGRENSSNHETILQFEYSLHDWHHFSTLISCPGVKTFTPLITNLCCDNTTRVTMYLAIYCYWQLIHLLCLLHWLWLADAIWKMNSDWLFTCISFWVRYTNNPKQLSFYNCWTMNVWCMQYWEIICVSIE